MVLTGIKLRTPFVNRMFTRAYNATITVLLWFGVLLLAKKSLDYLGLDWQFAQNVKNLIVASDGKKQSVDSTRTKTVTFTENETSKPQLKQQVDTLKKKINSQVKRYIHRGYEITAAEAAKLSEKERKYLKTL